MFTCLFFGFFFPLTVWCLRFCLCRVIGHVQALQEPFRFQKHKQIKELIALN